MDISYRVVDRDTGLMNEFSGSSVRVCSVAETFEDVNQEKERVFKIQQEARAVFEAAKLKETTPRRKLFASRPPSFQTFGVVCNDALQNDGSRSSPAKSLPDSGLSSKAGSHSSSPQPSEKQGSKNSYFSFEEYGSREKSSEQEKDVRTAIKNKLSTENRSYFKSLLDGGAAVPGDDGVSV